MRGQFERRFRVRMAFRLAALLALSCWFAAPARAGFPHHDGGRGAHKEIEKLELEWRDALLTNNISTIDNLLADDYLGISANGTLETKADVLAMRRSGRVTITELELSDVKIRIYGDTAVVTSRVDLAGKSGDRDIGGHFRYTRVYNYRGGEWKIVSFEASRIPGFRLRADRP
jgi:ketosteroid isomerase-like protein